MVDYITYYGSGDFYLERGLRGNFVNMGYYPGNYLDEATVFQVAEINGGCIMHHYDDTPVDEYDQNYLAVAQSDGDYFFY